MSLKIYPNPLLFITPETIEDNKGSYVYEEDSFIGSSVLVPVTTNGGSGTSAIGTLPTTIPILDTTTVLSLTASVGASNTFAARSGSAGRSFIAGQWAATFFMRFIIGAFTPIATPMNNSFLLAGFAGNTSIANPTTIDNGSILFIHDNAGVGIRTSNGTTVSTFRPSSTLILPTNTLHTMRLFVYRETPKADLFINRNLVMSADTTNFPAYNNATRGMYPLVQNARVLSDAVNPPPVIYVDDIAMLLTR